jgi:hypothetical protein
MSTTYRIDLDRMNRHKVITYFHYVNFNNGYAPLASAALALRWIGVPHLMPDWMTTKLRTAGLLSDDGDLAFTVAADSRAAPYGQSYGFPFEGAEEPNIVTVNLAALDTEEAAAVFKGRVDGLKQDHMTALRTVLDILGLPFPAWATRRGPNTVGSFTGMFAPATSMDDVESDELCDMLGLEAITPTRRAVA